MIILSNFQINVEPFGIFAKDGSVFLSMGERRENVWDDAGGIEVKPMVEISGISEGRCYVSQICRNHDLVVTTENGKILSFNSGGKLYSDGEGRFYWWKDIKNNKLIKYWDVVDDTFGVDTQRIPFRDQVFFELLPWWESVRFEISFDTCFQYSDSRKAPTDVVSVQQFSWSAGAECRKINGEWQLVSGYCSDRGQIEASMKYFPQDEKFPDTAGMESISVAVDNFCNREPELRKDYKKVDLPMFEVKLLTVDRAEEYYWVTDCDDIRGQFTRLNADRERIIASVAGFNADTDLAMVFGIFDGGEMVGFLDCYRKMDPEKRGDFLLEGEDEFREVFDDDFRIELDKRQLPLSPYFINIAIGKAFRGRKYAKRALEALMHILKEMKVSEVFMIIEEGNKGSFALAESMNADLISKDFYYLYRLKVPQ